MEYQQETEDTSELPPFFKTWTQLYWFVLIEFVCCLLFFIWLSA